MTPRKRLTHRWRRNTFSAALLMLALAGCGGQTAPEPTYYRLTAGPDVPSRAGGPLPGAVDVLPLRADGLVNERAILYRKSPDTVAGYNYNIWWEPPGVMLQESLVDALRHAAAFQLVTTPDLRLDRTYEIVGHIRHFEQDGATANVEVELMLRVARSGTPLLLKTYGQQVPAGDGSVAAVANAFSTAVAQIWAQFITDLANVTPPLPGR